jgi:superfamily II DNA or RNA helicase
VTQSALAKGRRVWLLAHRAELVMQIAGTLARYGCQHHVVAPAAIVRQCHAGQSAAHGRSYVDAGAAAWVCSVQTLARRLDTIPADCAPDLIVIDEAHHMTAGTLWGRVIDAYPSARLLAVTATPCRLDGRGLGVEAGGYADELIMGPTMRELIAAGALSPYRIYAPPTTLDLSGVRTRAGDYARDQLVGAVDRPGITGSAVEHYQRLTPGRRAVVFAVSVQHAQHVAADFRAAGISAEALDGSMAADERDAILRRFGAGDTLVLTSCDLVSEGVDLPAIEVAILLRPTQSLSLYLQQVGRALRVSPGKREAVILDHVGAVRRHGMPDEDRAWSLDGAAARKSRASDDDADAVERISTCPSCYTVHLPAPVCPTCGHTYPVRARQIEQLEGALQEITGDQAVAMRRQRWADQGRAQTVDDLMRALGMSRGRAELIIAAREAKAAQRQRVMHRIQLLGGDAHALLGVTIGDIMRAKPRELTELQSRLDVMLKDRQKQ